jgi:hypothetical protein
MGGTDGFDWRIASFRPKIITKSWVPKVFCHLLNAAMVNSYLIYKWHYGKLGVLNEKRFALSEFVEMLMAELAEEYLLAATPVAAASLGSNRRTKASWDSDPFRRTGLHLPKQTLLSSLADGEIRYKNENKFKRSNCIMCQRRVATQCEQCGIFLCLDAPANHDNCWKQFHTQKNIMRCPHHTSL